MLRRSPGVPPPELAPVSRALELGPFAARRGRLSSRGPHAELELTRDGAGWAATCALRFHFDPGVTLESTPGRGGASLRTLDPSFDARFVVHGHRVAALSRLGPKTRAALLALDPHATLALEGPAARLKTRRPLPPAKLAGALDALLTFCGRWFSPTPNDGARLLENAEHDDDLARREQTLELLFSHFSGSAEAKAGIALAEAAPEPALHVLARLGRGADPSPLLAALAADPNQRPEPRAQALRRLARHGAPDQVLCTLREVLESRPCGPLAEAAAELAGRLRDAACVKPLIALADTLPEAERFSVTQALGEIGAPEAETFLLAELAHPEPGRRIASATALGRLGARAALGPLRQLANHAFRAPDVARAAEAALARIETHLGARTAGSLSFADQNTGQLSRSDPRVGALGPPRGTDE